MWNFNCLSVIGSLLRQDLVSYSISAHLFVHSEMLGKLSGILSLFTSVNLIKWWPRFVIITNPFMLKSFLRFDLPNKNFLRWIKNHSILVQNTHLYNEGTSKELIDIVWLPIVHTINIIVRLADYSLLKVCWLIGSVRKWCKATVAKKIKWFQYKSCSVDAWNRKVVYKTDNIVSLNKMLFVV